MKRRNFLVSLFALPFAAMQSRYDMSAFSIEEDVDDPFVRLFDRNRREVSRNAEEIRALTEAMRLYAPKGFKSEPYRYALSDPRPLDALGRRIRKLREKK